MDDGGRGGNTPRGLVLDVSSFTESEAHFIGESLWNKFRLKTSLHKHNMQKNHV